MNQIKDVLDYEQPTNYIVDTDYYHNDSSATPVLTANKAFILGYTKEDWGIYDKGDCIIFDDFTMDLKYVDFPFKVRSSAIKILTTKRDINLRYVFEYLSFLNLSSNEHKRHYISELEAMTIQMASIERQNAIAKLLCSFVRKMMIENHLCNILCKQKAHFLQQMFI